jgi:hypothetical protein
LSRSIILNDKNFHKYNERRETISKKLPNGQHRTVSMTNDLASDTAH